MDVKHILLLVDAQHIFGSFGDKADGKLFAVTILQEGCTDTAARYALCT